ncbi:hypothetical protein [Streptomyces sp. Caat 7-52]|uniref:hypothetical protein n=1 Tax=Streptomyces sp. Caat 7-52 TaxID=2949637 RepID=UPI0020359633|nr:hypothetical protein [Streptomyces sp. Caat 7-52]
MQRRPTPPATATTTGPHPHESSTAARMLALLHRHRRTAAAQLLRGLCYGAGTGLTGLATWWLQQHL